MRKQWDELEQKIKEQKIKTKGIPVGLACQSDKAVFTLVFRPKRLIDPSFLYNSGSWTPTWVKTCECERRESPNYLHCRCGQPPISYDSKHEQKNIELANGNLIIEESDKQKAKILLPELYKKKRLIKSAITYGNKEGDRISVLCNTGEIFILSNTTNNHKKPIIIDKR